MSPPVAIDLCALPAAPHYWVAYSGGVDSHVLLHLLWSRRRDLRAPLGAVHVNHGIHSASGEWAVHCADVCRELDLPLVTLEADGNPRAGQSPEEAARLARYQVLGDWLAAGHIVLSAQHRDDQAETLLLQLFRGAGPRGLASMPSRSRLGQGWLQRPLLDSDREQVMAYARSQALRWIEDPSNSDERYRRNYLRHGLWPQLGRHWPGLSGTLARSAALQADQAELAQALALEDLRRCQRDDIRTLSVAALSSYSAARQRNLLRHWIERCGHALPSLRVIERIRSEALDSRDDAMPLVEWRGAQVRRYHGRVYLMSPLTQQSPAQSYRWHPRQRLILPDAGKTLSAQPVRGSGLRVEGNTELEVRFRRGGEILQPAGQPHHRRLKHLLQEWGIPPWERGRLPLIYSGNELAAVGDRCVCEGFLAAAGESGFLIRLDPVI